MAYCGHVSRVKIIVECMVKNLVFVLSGVNKFNLGHIFWTVRERDIIFDMHTQSMKHFQLIPNWMTWWPWLTFDLHI